MNKLNQIEILLNDCIKKFPNHKIEFNKLLSILTKQKIIVPLSPTINNTLKNSLTLIKLNNYAYSIIFSSFDTLQVSTNNHNKFTYKKMLISQLGIMLPPKIGIVINPNTSLEFRFNDINIFFNNIDEINKVQLYKHNDPNIIKIHQQILYQYQNDILQHINNIWIQQSYIRNKDNVSILIIKTKYNIKNKEQFKQFIYKIYQQNKYKLDILILFHDDKKWYSIISLIINNQSPII